MDIQQIPKEVLDRAMILGHLPEEYIEDMAYLIEQTIMNGPNIEYSREPKKIPILDETINRIGDTAAAFLIRRLYPNADKKVKSAIHQSRAMSDLIKRNGWGSKILRICQGRLP